MVIFFSLLYSDVCERGKEARPGLVPVLEPNLADIPVVVGEINYE